MSFAFDEYEDVDEHGTDSHAIVCDRCGADGLHWSLDEQDAFRLMNEDGTGHMCHDDLEGLALV